MFCVCVSGSVWSHAYVSADRYPQRPAGTGYPGAGLTGHCKPPPWLLGTVPSSLWSLYWCMISLDFKFISEVILEINLLLFYTYDCFDCMHVCPWHVCLLSRKASRGQEQPWNWSTRWWWATTWMLEPEYGLSARTASVLSHQDLSGAPQTYLNCY